ncbi:uncharacterized protein [Channa argus]|uniref:uncharacterized protein n=1 Tax=Channa argus TaxID=215402 RepID=UPI0035206341
MKCSSSGSIQKCCEHKCFSDIINDPKPRVCSVYEKPAVITSVVTGQFSSFTVRDGDDVTLPCGNVRDDQEKCNKTTWNFSDSGNTAAVELVKLGKIKPESKSKSDRLSVTENCSLVIKKVTDEDVGRYTCRQFDNSGRQLGSDSAVDVSVVTRTGHKDDDKVTLTCSVWTHGPCGHTVKWLYDHNKNEFTDTETPQSSCSVTVTLTTSDLNQKYSDLLKCEVTDGFSGEVQQFTFRRPSSGGTSGEERKTKTTTSTQQATTTSVKSTSTMRSKVTIVKTNTSGRRNNKVWLWCIIVVAVGLAVIVFAIIKWKKNKGKETGMDENRTDPENELSYASISYSRKKDSKAQDPGDDDDEGDTVTYSSVKASTDPGVVYAAINKPKK